jgi:hypothetical protein
MESLTSVIPFKDDDEAVAIGNDVVCGPPR